MVFSSVYESSVMCVREWEQDQQRPLDATVRQHCNLGVKYQLERGIYIVGLEVFCLFGVSVGDMSPQIINV